MKKKLIIGALALSMCLSFASCDKINGILDGILGGDSSSSSSTVETEYDVIGAADALYGSLVDQNEETRVDYEVPNTFTYLKNVYTITWSVDVTEGVALVKGESATTVDVDENAQADVPYVLTAVVTDPNGETETVTFERKVLKAPPCVPEDITAKPVEGKAYKLYVYQSTKKADCYFTGKMSDFYYATSENDAEGVNVYAEYKEGSETEFYLSFKSPVDGKQYITIEEGWNSKSSHWTFNPQITSEAKTAFVYSEEYKTIVATILARSYDDYSNEAAEPSVDTTVYLGNYSNYMTFSVSKVSNLGKAGNNVGNLVEMINKNEISAEDKVAFEKETLSLAEKYVGDTTVELTVLGNRYKDVTIAWAEESDNLAISADGKTLTITAPAAETTVTVTATLTCGTVTDTKEITLTIAPKTDVEGIANPSTTDAYKFYLQQVSLGKTLYLDGTVSGRYLNMTEDASKAKDIYAEQANDGYKFYFLDGETKQYINAETVSEKQQLNFAATTDSVFKYNSTTKCWYTNLDGTDYYMGTYNTFTTVSLSKTSFITADNTGVSQFPANLILASEVSTDTPDTPDKPETPTMTPSEIVDAAFALDKDTSLNGSYTLTGVVIMINASYSEENNNVTVTMVVENKNDKPIQCFRLTGTDANVIKVGDTITVTGTLKNYNNTIEFDSGCTLDSYVAGEPVADPEGILVLSFTNKDNRTAYSESQQVWEQNGVKLTNNQGSSTSKVGNYYSPARFYKSSNATVECAGMTKIEFVCDAINYALELQKSIAADENITVTISGLTVIVEFTTPVDSFAISSFANQVRLNCLKVTK